MSSLKKDFDLHLKVVQNITALGARKEEANEKENAEEIEIFLLLIKSIDLKVKLSSKQERIEFFKLIAIPHQYLSYVPTNFARDWVMKCLYTVSLSLNKEEMFSSPWQEMLQMSEITPSVTYEGCLKDVLCGQSAVESFAKHVSMLKFLNERIPDSSSRDALFREVKTSAVNMFVDANMEEVADLIAYICAYRWHLDDKSLPKDLVRLTLLNASVLSTSDQISPLAFLFLTEQLQCRVPILIILEGECQLLDRRDPLVEKVTSLISDVKGRFARKKLCDEVGAERANLPKVLAEAEEKLRVLSGKTGVLLRAKNVFEGLNETESKLWCLQYNVGMIFGKEDSLSTEAEALYTKANKLRKSLAKKWDLSL